MLSKQCTRCGQILSAGIEHFYRHPQCKFGLDSVCRNCRNSYIRQWKERNRTRIIERRRALYKERYGARQRELERRRYEEHPLRVQAERLVSGIRDRCHSKGLERDSALASKRFFMEWLRRQPSCACCGVPFVIGPKNGPMHDASPSIDRFNPREGYTLDNIALICWRCNNIKRNYSSSDLRRVADWIDAWGNQAGLFDGTGAQLLEVLPSV